MLQLSMFLPGACAGRGQPRHHHEHHGRPQQYPAGWLPQPQTAVVAALDRWVRWSFWDVPVSLHAMMCLMMQACRPTGRRLLEYVGGCCCGCEFSGQDQLLPMEVGVVRGGGLVLSRSLSRSGSLWMGARQAEKNRVNGVFSILGG